MDSACLLRSRSLTPVSFPSWRSTEIWRSLPWGWRPPSSPSPALRLCLWTSWTPSPGNRMRSVLCACCCLLPCVMLSLSSPSFVKNNTAVSSFFLSRTPPRCAGRRCVYACLYVWVIFFEFSTVGLISKPVFFTTSINERTTFWNIYISTRSVCISNADRLSVGD